MASKFPVEREEKVLLRPRKGHDMTWSCDKHGDPVKFYCKKHETPICHPCATKDHGQKPCELKDIEDVIFEMKRKLEDKVEEIKEMNKLLQMLDTKIESTATVACNHFQSVSERVTARFEDIIKNVKVKEQEKIRLIIEEADKEIRVIYENRDRRIRTCIAEAEQQRVILKESQGKVMSDLKKISGVVAKKTEELKNKNQHAIDTMHDMSCKIKRIKEVDQKLVTEAPQVLASIDENLSANIANGANQNVVHYLDRIQREVKRVKLVESELGGEHFARIDGYGGKWELVKSIDISSIVKRPHLCGWICNDKICVTDNMSKKFYVTDLSSGHTASVGDRKMDITSCAPIDSNVIVCGKREGKRITLCDRHGKVIRRFPIPLIKPSLYIPVHVDVDRNGVILAYQKGQSNIYAISPADGKVVKTIQGQHTHGRIQTLSSGDIVTTSGKECIVISRSGEEKFSTYQEDWYDLLCSVDKLTDTIYITYRENWRNTYVVDQVSCDGDIQAKGIVEYTTSYGTIWTSPCLATPCGRLVACDEDKLLVYEKNFNVELNDQRSRIQVIL